MAKGLKEIVSEKPFKDYAEWWDVGTVFSTFMSNAIHGEWLKLINNTGDLFSVRNYAHEYLSIVFDSESRSSLVFEFAKNMFLADLQSGQFDALSYAYYRSAFELIEANIEHYEHSLERERRLFTMRVGKIFFDQVYERFALDLPESLESEEQFVQMKDCIKRVGDFLVEQGYLRDHFAFRFDVDLEHNDRHIKQVDRGFLANIDGGGTGFALYEMGYPIILPSAVYLYHTIGEAQHHSSRTIEELFDRVGYEARETDDFDPTGYPSDMVVELWEIRKKAEAE
ncbi:MAG: hypothetical protein AB8G95_16185 [Anaerolineae bacterium]